MSVAALTKLFNAPGIAAGTLLSAAGKVAPKLVPFISGSLTAGYGADQVLDFMRNKYGNPAEKREREMLTARASQGVARPDEKAFLSQMEQRSAPLDQAQQLLKLGSQVAGGIGGVRASNQAQAQEAMQAEQQQASVMQQQEQALKLQEQALAQRAARDQKRATNAEEQKTYQRSRHQAIDERRAKERAENEARRAPKAPQRISIPQQELQRLSTIADGIEQGGVRDPASIEKALSGLGFKKDIVKQFVADRGSKGGGIDEDIAILQQILQS